MNLKHQIGLMLGLTAVFVFLFWDNITAFLRDSTSTVNFISVIGTIVTLGSFIYALYEKSNRQQLEEKRRSQLWASIDRARYTIIDDALIREIQVELNPHYVYRIWLTHQVASDLYISLIEQYLANIESFTYKDLEYMCKNEVVLSKWQERQWRVLICQRPENKNLEPPEYFVKTNLSQTFKKKEDK